MNPDEQAFYQDIESAAFQIGCDEDIWGIHKDERVKWPHVIIWIRAVQKQGAPDRYYLKFDAKNYPSRAPTACPWDIEKNQRLISESWPRGKGNVQRVFNPVWNGGNALYLACDRVAMEGHPDWKHQHSDLWWQSTDSMVKYLKYVYWLLNTTDYVKG